MVGLALAADSSRSWRRSKTVESTLGLITKCILRSRQLVNRNKSPAEVHAYNLSIRRSRSWSLILTLSRWQPSSAAFLCTFQFSFLFNLKQQQILQIIIIIKCQVVHFTSRFGSPPTRPRLMSHFAWV